MPARDALTEVLRSGRAGWRYNHERTYRIYKEDRLNLRRKPPRRSNTAAHRQQRPALTGPHQCWSMDLSAIKSFVATILVLICSVVVLSQHASPNASIPGGWRKTNANGLFTFYLPQSAWDTGFSSLEGFYKEYRIGQLAFRFEYEPMGLLAYENREKAFGRDFQESVVEINGRKTYMFAYSKMLRGRKRYYTEIHVGDLPKGQVKLMMQADSWRPSDLEIAKKIFSTVEFLKP